jgi:hypothetical protein
LQRLWGFLRLGNICGIFSPHQMGIFIFWEKPLKPLHSNGLRHLCLCGLVCGNFLFLLN